MSWVRLDDGFLDHPKFIEAGPLAGYIAICAIAWCNRNLTDGFIPVRQVRRLVDFTGFAHHMWNGEMFGGGEDADPMDLAKELVQIGLWDEAEGGFRIHDYHDYQPRADQVRQKREKNSLRQKKFRDKGSCNAVTNCVTNKVTNETVTGAPNPNPNPREAPSSSLRSEEGAPKPAHADSARRPSGKPTKSDLDALKDALADAVGYAPSKGNKAAWGPFQSAASSLFAEGAKPEDVPRVAKAYRREWPDVEMTPTSLAKHWARFARRKAQLSQARASDPRTEADLLLQEAWQKAQKREDLDDAKRDEISRQLVAALNHGSNPVGAVKAVRERYDV